MYGEIQIIITKVTSMNTSVALDERILLLDNTYKRPKKHKKAIVERLPANVGRNSTPQSLHR
jgi:hypothetical protein